MGTPKLPQVNIFTMKDPKLFQISAETHKNMFLISRSKV